MAAPFGGIFAAVEHDGTLVRFDFVGVRRIETLIELLERRAYSVTWNADALREVVIRVYEYFDRKRQEFDARVRLLGTPFQRMVWNQLTRSPFGQTLSYRELAALVGKAEPSERPDRRTVQTLSYSSFLATES